MAQEPTRQDFDPGLQLALEELRHIRVEVRDDRRSANASADADRRQAEVDRRRSDERFEKLLHEFREESGRRETGMLLVLEGTQKAFKDVRSVGLSIVKTLNRHSRLLESIDRKLGVRGNGGPGNGRRP